MKWLCILLLGIFMSRFLGTPTLGTDEYLHTGRTATYVIAASDAPANVKAQADYVCDGTADDVQIQAAIDAVAISGGGIVQLSSGTFNIAATITIGVTQDYISLIGSGRSATKLYLVTNTDSPVIKVGDWGHTGGYTQFVHLGNFLIDGNGANNDSDLAKGLWIDTAFDCLFENIYIQCTYGSGLFIDGQSGALATRGCLFSNVHIELPTPGTTNPAIDIQAYVGDNIFFRVEAVNTPDMCMKYWGYSNEFIGCWFGSSLGQFKVVINQTPGFSTGTTFAHCFFDGTMPDNSYVVYLTTSSGDITGVNIADCLFNCATGAGVWYVAFGAGLGTLIRDVNIHDCIFEGSSLAVTSRTFTIFGDGTYSHINIHDNTLNQIQLPLYPSVPAGITLINNQGYIASGEIRTVSGSLTAGNANAFAFAWQNPEAQAIVILEVMVDETTAGGTAGSLLDVGTAANATTTSDNLIDGADLNATNTLVSTARVKLAANGGATDWITGQILVANAASLVGTYKVTYMGD
jgi:hypothetical protein